MDSNSFAVGMSSRACSLTRTLNMPYLSFQTVRRRAVEGESLREMRLKVQGEMNAEMKKELELISRELQELRQENAQNKEREKLALEQEKSKERERTIEHLQRKERKKEREREKRQQQEMMQQMEEKLQSEAAKVPVQPTFRFLSSKIRMQLTFERQNAISAHRSSWR